jgi:RimJ/RimL family protein N-acetyltransferase
MRAIGVMLARATQRHERSPMTHYFLRTERLGFRHWSIDDVELAMALWGDARVMRHVGGPFARDLVIERLEHEIATMNSRGVQYWPTFRLADGAHVGCAGLKASRAGDDVLELGFYLRPEHWGVGYASESARAVIDYAFGALGVHAVFAGHHPENEGSRRVLERMGFRYSHHELYPPTGVEHPGYLLKRGEHFNDGTSGG